MFCFTMNYAIIPVVSLIEEVRQNFFEALFVLLDKEFLAVVIGIFDKTVSVVWDVICCHILPIPKTTPQK